MMKRYEHLFNSNAEYEEYIENNYEEPFVAVIKQQSGDDILKFNLTEYEKLLEMPLTFEALSDGVLRWGYDYYGEEDPYEGLPIEYRKNKGEWTTINPSQYEFDDDGVITGGGTSISVVSGDVVEFRGDYQAYGDDWEEFQHFLNGTGSFNLMGNIMSLVNSTGYPSETVLQSAYAFAWLFSVNESIINASKLILPATTLANKCYSGMFDSCTSLTTAPELPSTTLGNSCYRQMFYGCTSLTSAPSILPATTLADYCYMGMFWGCTSLNYIKCLATDISATSCTASWVNGVSSSGTFVKNPSMSSWSTGNSGIPTNWTVQDA